MFCRYRSRHVAVAAQSVVGVCRVRGPPCAGARRCYSSASRDSEHASASKSRSRLVPALALLGAGGLTVYALARERDPAQGSASSANPVPSFTTAASPLDIPVKSPVQSLGLDAANAKIRQQTSSFIFDSKDGAKGRVDVVRVSSNNPVEDNWAVGIGPGAADGRNVLFSGVYDGHAGWATSTVLRETLIPYVSSSLAKLSPSSENTDVDDAIKKAFVDLDARIMDNAMAVVKAHQPGAPEAVAAIAPATAGSCALLTVYDPITSVLRTAVTGDSRAVLGSYEPSQSGTDAFRFAAHALSKDQTGFNQLEVDRLSAEHPGEKDDILDPKSGRLLGMAITRGFGDHRWKWPLDFLRHLQANFFDVGPRPKYKTPPYMTARPEVTTRVVTADDFVILASDGLWDHMSNEVAVECVSRWLAAKRAGKAEQVSQGGRPAVVTADKGWMTWTVTPDDFAIEDLDSAAVCLVKNAFGGNRRELLRGVLTSVSPASRYARDDVTVQVIFFKDPYQA